MSVENDWWQNLESPPVGVGLKGEHYADVLSLRPKLSFFEVHAENYMSEGGAHHRYLEEIANHYALSVHGVGLSLGSAEGVNPKHLERFKQVVERYNPVLVSEHLAWSVQEGTYLNDLLPLPFTKECMRILHDNISHVQDALGRQILIENPSSYVSFTESEYAEPDFLCELASRTDCGLLLDINNVYVSGSNMDWDPHTYLSVIPADLIGEVHLAGHTLKNVGEGEIRIDDHGSEVCEGVWDLFRETIQRIGRKPTLIEWDSNIPPFHQLLAQANQAADALVVAAQNKAFEDA